MEKVDVLQAVLVASVRHALPMRNITGWQEKGEEMAGNGGVFIELEQEVDDDQMNTDHTREPFLLLSVFTHISDYRPVCGVSQTSCYIEPFLFSCLNANSSSE